MPGINVSALSGGDLRRLLKVAHTRHDGLLADRLEWEIAARATSGGRPAPAFASHDDDEDEAVEPIVAPQDEVAAFAPEPAAPADTVGTHRLREDTVGEPARPRGVLLVTLGAVAGSLLSAAVFWGLERANMREAPSRVEPRPVIAMSPAAEQVALALLAPEPLVLPEAPAAAKVETALPVAPPPVEVAKASVKKHAVAKAAPRPKRLTVARADRPARPPNLAEWLASEPDEPIH